MARTGQPTKLTPERQEEIVSAIQAGNYQDVAAAYAGIGRSTFYSWKARGEKDKKAKNASIYADFLDAVKKAESDAEVRAVAIIQRAMPDNWQAAMTYLERKFPDRWSRGERREHTGGTFHLKIGSQWIGNDDDSDSGD